MLRQLITLYDPHRSVAGNAQQSTSQIGSRVEDLMATDTDYIWSNTSFNTIQYELMISRLELTFWTIV